ncbi:neuferricin isoform X2 [Microtus ochrogaster]|uniref:Neuferricin isoform X2 n=1 Tax=Microtus ochrogaster TaxID=79684 RepID=A0ABM1U1I3_MICOH|nr:neuferricin isoform X2 [Microtus ochrogaster]
MLRLCGLGVVLSLVAAAAAVMTVWLMDWWGPEGPPSGLRLFVPEELARYRGGPGDPGLYLALLGRVYDVSSGRRHYEPGAHYSGFAGRLVGRFYREDGLPTSELTQVEAMVTEGMEANEERQREKHKFPPCNAEWSSAKGSRVWCSQKSGGVNRDWIGVPRKMYKPGAKEPHCVCVRTTGPPSDQQDNPRHSNRGDLDNPNLEEYTGCSPLAMACSFPL